MISYNVCSVCGERIEPEIRLWRFSGGCICENCIDQTGIHDLLELTCCDTVDEMISGFGMAEEEISGVYCGEDELFEESLDERAIRSLHNSNQNKTEAR